jgi:hypothetical protein
MAIADVAEYAHLSDADEHHLYPDLPSNRYAEIAQQVRAVCATYDLPDTTGPLDASTCSRCARCASWRSPIGSCPPPPTTHPRRHPKTSSAMSRNDRTCQPGAMTMRGDADWVLRYWTERIGGRRVDQCT